jgi:TonB family protein
MTVVLAAALAGIVAFFQSAAPQADRVLKAPDCQTLVMTSPGPGIVQLCQGEAAMRRAEAAGATTAEGQKQLASAASELERAADVLRDVDLKIYAVEALIRLYDDTHLKQPNAVEQALRSLIPLMPGSSSPLRRIATIQEAQGQIDAAENTLLGARQQVPDDVEVYRALSEFYARRATQVQVSTENARAGRHGDPVAENVPDVQDAEPVAQNAEPAAPNSGPDSDGYYSIGGNIPPPKPMTRRVPALRSPEADAAGVSGAVILEIRVDETGGVADAKILRSIPMLDDAAIATVKQWRYAPTLIEGRAVPVKMIVTVNYPPAK